MKTTTKKLITRMSVILSQTALLAAIFASTQACFWFFYQPETPAKIEMLKKDK